MSTITYSSIFIPILFLQALWIYSVGLVPYAKPGSAELFEAFKKCVGNSDGFLLAHHGPIVGGSSMMEAFYNLEELEESARIAWELQKDKQLEKIDLIS